MKYSCWVNGTCVSKHNTLRDAGFANVEHRVALFTWTHIYADPRCHVTDAEGRDVTVKANDAYANSQPRRSRGRGAASRTERSRG